jgi:hypothetical protein
MGQAAMAQAAMPQMMPQMLPQMMPGMMGGMMPMGYGFRPQDKFRVGKKKID